jgi:hypothetical protein
MTSTSAELIEFDGHSMASPVWRSILAGRSSAGREWESGFAAADSVLAHFTPAGRFTRSTFSNTLTNA